MKELFLLNKYFKKYWYYLLPGFICVICANFFDVLPAKIIRCALDLIMYNIATYRLFDNFDQQSIVYHIFSSSLLLFAMVVLSFSAIRGVFLFMMRQTIILMSRHIEFDMKNEIYAHYQCLDIGFFRKNNTGDLMSRASEDVSRVRMYVGPSIMYALNMLGLFGLILVSMLMVNVKLTIFSLLPLPALVITIYLVQSKIHKKSEQIQAQVSTISSFVQETFSGIRVVKAYVTEKDKTRDFAVESENYKRKAMSLAKVQALFFPAMLLMVSLSTILTIYVGGLEVINGEITAGNIAEFIVYVTQLTFPVMSLGWVITLIQRAAASQKRINEFLLQKPKIINPTNENFDLQGDIELKNVNFTYEDTGIQALKNINLHIEKGSFIAIIGKTGSGKSTLAQLLLRMYDVQCGEIIVDGKPIKQINLERYRQQIGFVPQEVFLFSDSIENNIAFGVDNATEVDVYEAAKNAAIYENIMGFKQQFKTILGERGVTLSGGQKQRVSISRALIKHPNVLIFDNCLSAVDTKTEEEILSNLGKMMKGKTSIIISHRISTIKNADKIIVLDNGEIIEQGTHKELLELNGSYSDLYENQLLEEQENAL